MLKDYIGTRIKEMREYKNWTQQDLADRSSVSRAYISQLERGDSEPTASVLQSIASAFKVPVDIFFPGTTLMPFQALENFYPEDVVEFLRNQKNLPYLQLMMEASKVEVSPKFIEELIRMVREARKMSEQGEK